MGAREDDDGWDQVDNAASYDRFWDEHPRYRLANEALVERLEAAAPQARSILDLAAGTGRTAARLLERFGDEVRITCFEPASAMRRRGEARAPRAKWVPAWPSERFDAVLCACAIWQLPLATTFTHAAAGLPPGGAFVFDIPALYLGIPDEPGGGNDPTLTDGLVGLARATTAPSTPAPNPPFLGGVAGVEAALDDAGFSVVVHEAQRRLRAHELRDWLTLPVISRAVVPNADAEARAEAIHRAFADVDAASWRWEGWRLFVATKRR